MSFSGIAHGSQRAYRCLLQATASPGKLFNLPATSGADDGSDAAEIVLLTLLDVEVTFRALGPGAGEVEERISRATGARRAPAGEEDFLLVLGGDSGGALRGLKRGSLESPEEGATVVYAVERLSVGGPLTLALSGPGVLGERSLGVEGLARAEVEALRESRAAYPMGVDAYLVDASGLVAGLPRSTRIGVVG